MRISVELVPREKDQVLADATTVREVMPQANAFNIPDLLRFPLRSWDACALVSRLLPAAIPHIRAIDIAPGEEVPVAQRVIDAGLSEVLVIQGDPPHDLSHRAYPHTSEEIIRRFKRHHPTLKVFAGFDPYRQSFQDELKTVGRKIDAGADGFFTQPIFDIRLLEICAEMLRGLDVFWGIAPVVGERAKAYWETTNKIVFPTGFAPTLEWNRSFAFSAIKSIRGFGANAYFMPIRVNLTDYLRGLLDE
jgi:methylenetetrahydrofolate reductase (NADPH)